MILNKSKLNSCFGTLTFVFASNAFASPMISGYTRAYLDTLQVSVTGTAGTTLNWNADTPVVEGGLDANPADFPVGIASSSTSSQSGYQSEKSSVPTLDLSHYWTFGSEFGTDAFLSQVADHGAGAWMALNWRIVVNGKGTLTASMNYDLGLNVVNDTDNVYAQGLSIIVMNINNQYGMGNVDFISPNPSVDIGKLGNWTSLSVADTASSGALTAQWDFNTCQQDLVGINADGSPIYVETCNPLSLFLNVNADNSMNIASRPGYVASPTTGTVPAPATLYLIAGGLLFIQRWKKIGTAKICD